MIPSLESLGEKLSELTASTVDPDEALSLQIDSLSASGVQGECTVIQAPSGSRYDVVPAIEHENYIVLDLGGPVIHLDATDIAHMLGPLIHKTSILVYRERWVDTIASSNCLSATRSAIQSGFVAKAGSFSTECDVVDSPDIYGRSLAELEEEIESATAQHGDTSIVGVSFGATRVRDSLRYLKHDASTGVWYISPGPHPVRGLQDWGARLDSAARSSTSSSCDPTCPSEAPHLGTSREKYLENSLASLYSMQFEGQGIDLGTTEERAKLALFRTSSGEPTIATVAMLGAYCQLAMPAQKPSTFTTLSSVCGNVRSAASEVPVDEKPWGCLVYDPKDTLVRPFLPEWLDEFSSSAHIRQSPGGHGSLVSELNMMQQEDICA